MKSVLMICTAVAIFFSAASLSAQQQPPGPSTVGFLNGTEFILEDEYQYIIGSTDYDVTVPSGFVTDFASIPSVFLAFLASQSDYSRAALIHDFLYWSQICTRLQADNLFLIAMKESDVSPVKRATIYRGVRLGGGTAWQNNTAERRRGKPRVVPKDLFNLADHHSWKNARRILISRGAKDPKFAVTHAACALGNSTAVP